MGDPVGNIWVCLKIRLQKFFWTDEVVDKKKR